MAASAQGSGVWALALPTSVRGRGYVANARRRRTVTAGEFPPGPSLMIANQRERVDFMLRHLLVSAFFIVTLMGPKPTSSIDPAPSGGGIRHGVGTPIAHGHVAVPSSPLATSPALHSRCCHEAPEAGSSSTAMPMNLRPGGRAALLPNGELLVVEPFCGSKLEDPSVLWYLMEASGYCSACQFAPYNPLSGPPYVQPNPNRPAGSGHFNVARHWSSSPTYYVYVPMGYGGLSNDILTGQQKYTYQEFLWDVAYTFAKFSSITTTPSVPPVQYGAHPCSGVQTPAVMGLANSSISAYFGGIAAPNGLGDIWPASNPPPYSPPAQFDINFIWPTTAVSAGPTGNGIHEVMFLPLGQYYAGFQGLTSMLVNPLTGQIQECDVIFNSQSGAWTSSGQPTPTPCAGQPNGAGPYGPPISTSFGHEIGHFFGLDHTNLHPGDNGLSYQSTPPPTIGSGAPGTFASFTSFTEYPEMVGNTTNTNYWRTHPFPPSQTQPLHPDDCAGMAELYPVVSPSAVGAAQLRPSINDFGRIVGSVAGPISSFGLNVYPVSVAKPAPMVGKLAGTCRASNALGVVGRTDTESGIPSSGEFVIDGVPPSIAGLSNWTYSMVVEPVESLGFAIPGAAAPGNNTWAEWFHDGTLNNQGVNRIWRVSLDGFSSLKMFSRFPHATSRGTMFIAPGTVLNLNFPQTDNVIVIMTENVTRPVVELDNRTGYPTPFSGSYLQATVTHDYLLEYSSAVWQVGASPGIPAGVPFIPGNPNPPSGTGPWTTVWRIPFSSTLGVPSLFGATQPTTPQTVKFVVREHPARGGVSFYPPVGTPAVYGVNEVRY
jgi:hypothetical protein